MLLWIFRLMFLILVVMVVYELGSSTELTKLENAPSWWALLWSSICMTTFVFLLDVLTPKRKLSAIAGIFFGLIVGILISYALSFVVDMIIDTYSIHLIPEAVVSTKWVLGICVCYFVVSIVMRTKDDVRFVIPYVEFAKQTKGARPLVLDTSVIIDGRIADLCQSKLFDAPVVIPRFVLNELQLIADSADKLKRNRGRRGLDMLRRMQQNEAIDVEIDETAVIDIEQDAAVDQKLIMFTKGCNGRLATTDYNLSKVAQVRGVDVVNVNDLANSLKTVALPGEIMQTRIIKAGEEAEQGIGYLDDGTMVVVEGGRDKIGREVVISITSALQTSAGKMIFGKFERFVEKAKKQ